MTGQWKSKTNNIEQLYMCVDLAEDLIQTVQLSYFSCEAEL